MVSDNDEPADLAAFRARREELKRERRRQKARYDFTVMAPHYGREIPPRLNPDIPDMVDPGQILLRRSHAVDYGLPAEDRRVGRRRQARSP